MKLRIEHPYEALAAGGSWLRGNLHAHTTRSDGRLEPQAVVAAYAARGYDFLMISDHDIHTSPEDLAALNAKGLVLIPGNEVSADGSHILHVNGRERIAPDPRRQAVLNAIVAENQGFAIIAHPNWRGQFDHTSITQLREWVGYEGVEIYNGVIGRLDGSPYATNKWDMLLSEERRVWGFANDDSHWDTDFALGWNMAFAKEKTAPAILDALRRGCFYASSGVVINDIRVTGDRIVIETENASRIVALGRIGRRFGQVDAAVMEFTVPPGVTPYIRFECWGTGEQFAWTQPFFIHQAAEG